MSPASGTTPIQPVILCGGSGTRLWPESRETYPKPFLPLIDGRSLYELTLERCAALPGALPPIVVVNAQQAHLAEQAAAAIGHRIPRLVIEPVGRNTAPAIAAAALVATADGSDPTLLVLPADHLIAPPDAFATAVAQAAQAGGDRLVTFGVVPTYPETGYGYIEAPTAEGSSADAVRPVERFVEKPDIETARGYLAGGRHFWNAGIFVFRASLLLAELRQHSPTVATQVARAVAQARQSEARTVLPAAEFGECPNISIDYALFEKSRIVSMVPARFEWSDIGSWKAVADVSRGVGNAVVNVGSSDCFVRSDGRTVGLVGVANLVVIDTEDALLIAHRDHTQDVRQVVERVREIKPALAVWRTTAVRPWGTFTVLSDLADHKVKRIVVNPGASISLQLHHHRSETWTFISGHGEVTLDDRTITVGPEVTVHIPVRTKHRVRNTGGDPLVFIETQTGTSFEESDIVRFEDQYGRI